MGSLRRVLSQRAEFSEHRYLYKGYSGYDMEKKLEVGGVNSRLLLQVVSRAMRNKSHFMGMGMSKH